MTAGKDSSASILTRDSREIAKSILSALHDVCEEFIKAEPEFWLLVGLTDASYETGMSKHYRRAINSFVVSGLVPSLVERLRLGVNNILAEGIYKRHPQLAPVKANLARGPIRPDLWFGTSTDGTETIVEVKGVYDMTIPPFYGHKDGHGIADDRDKLLTIRRDGFKGQLHQIVFFLEVPNYSYPSGCSFPPDWKKHGSRKSFQWCPGISAQYAEVRKHLGAPSAEGDRPHIYALPKPRRSRLEFAERWLGAHYRPDDPEWRFIAEKQLANAAVGFAIWSY